MRMILTWVHSAAAGDGVAGVAGRARADGDVASDLAVGVDAARTRTCVHALVVETFAVCRAIRAVCNQTVS